MYQVLTLAELTDSGEAKGESPQPDQSSSPNESNTSNKAASKQKKCKITRCPHTEAKHYAKGMCNHCYHIYGRKNLATKCEHTTMMTYAKGMCHTCYFKQYNSKKAKFQKERASQDLKRIKS